MVYLVHIGRGRKMLDTTAVIHCPACKASEKMKTEVIDYHWFKLLVYRCAKCGYVFSTTTVVYYEDTTSGV